MTQALGIREWVLTWIKITALMKVTFSWRRQAVKP